MTAKSAKFTAKSRFWMENEKGKPVFGPGRLKILSAVEECGSMYAASAKLSMSNKAVWGKIKATEDHLGRKLLIKNTTGSELTPFAKALIRRFQYFETLMRLTVDKLFQEHFGQILQNKYKDTRGRSSYTRNRAS